MSTVGYFDGAEQGGNRGDGMVIRIMPDISYRLRMGISRGTKTKAAFGPLGSA